MTTPAATLKPTPRKASAATGGRLVGGSFARHESFHFRDGWLAKGLEAVAEDSQLFTRADAMETLGVGKNMVNSIRHWVQALRLVEECPVEKDKRRSRVIGYRVSPLGKLLRRHDPYFESDDTLWILQLQLASNLERATTWYWAFNLFGQTEFNRMSFLTQLRRYLAQESAQGVADNSLEKDYSCFTRMYVARKGLLKTDSPEDLLDCPLAALNLLTTLDNDRTFRFNLGSRPTLRPAVFVYALYRYAEARHPGAVTIPFESIQWDRESPGRLFCLDAEAILAYIEKLGERRGGPVSFTRTAGLNQIVLKGRRDSSSLLKEIYARANR